MYTLLLAKKINESNDSVASCFNILIKLYDFWNRYLNRIISQIGRGKEDFWKV